MEESAELANLEIAKEIAKTLLLKGLSTEDIAEQLAVPEELIKEWARADRKYLSVIKQTNYAVEQKAIELLSKSIDVDGMPIGIKEMKMAILQDSIQDKAMELLEGLNTYSMLDKEEMTAAKNASDVLTSLQKAFFNLGPDIAIQNNISNDTSNSTVSKFKGLMKA